MFDPLAEIDEVFNDIVADVKAAFAWVYNWITVLTGIVAGALAFLPDLLNQLLGVIDAAGVVDFTVFGISQSTAAAITFGVAVAKGLLAYYRAAD